MASHISRNTSEMPRISCMEHWTRLRVRLSFEERRMKFAEPTEFYRKLGMWRTHRFVVARKFSNYVSLDIRATMLP